MLKRILDITKNGFRYLLLRLIKKFKYLGWPVVFGSGIEIENANIVSIGSLSNIGKDTWMRSALSGLGNGITIGSGVDIGRRNFISCTSEIIIGDNCVFGPNVTVVDNNHEYKDLSKAIKAQGSSNPVSISIGNDCWLGSNVVVLPGTNIGKHCVIAANCVVSGTVPNYCVVAGIPGKVVKKFDRKLGLWVKR